MGKTDYRCSRIFYDLWEPLSAAGTAKGERVAGTVRVRDAVGPGAPSAARRQDLPAALPIRWALIAFLAALVGVASLLVRLFALGEPLPTPVLVHEPTPRAASTGVGAAAATSSTAETTIRATPAAAATPRSPAQLGTYARTLEGGASSVPLRTQPGGAVAGAPTVSAGAILEVVGEPVDVNGVRWRRLRDGDARLGWIAESQLTILQPSLGETSSEIELMAAPGRSARRVARIPAGVPVAIIDTREGEAADRGTSASARWHWVRVITTGEVGWAPSETVKQRGF